MPARRWESGSARLRLARRSVRRRTHTTIRITTPTGTPTRRRPIILRHLIILRVAAGIPITGAITRAELGCQSIRSHGVATLALSCDGIKAPWIVVFAFEAELAPAT